MIAEMGSWLRLFNGRSATPQLPSRSDDPRALQERHREAVPGSGPGCRRKHTRPAARNWLLSIALLGSMLFTASSPIAASERALTIVAFGDSLTAGYQLPPSAAFPVRLEKALRDQGHNIKVVNAGVSGDTASTGLARLDWAVPADADAVIVELGANDALRGIDPGVTRAALDEIMTRLTARGAAVLLAGMAPPRNLGHAYAERYGSIFPELANKHGAILYPFFLEGVATLEASGEGEAVTVTPNLKLLLSDGLHPNAQGIDVIVKNILPFAERLIDEVRTRTPSTTQ